MELITVAVVKFVERGNEPFLYRAPRWELTEGAKVVCEDPFGDKNADGEYYEAIGEIVALHDVFLDGDEYRFMLQIAGVNELRRIKAEIRRKEFNYPTITEEEQEEQEEAE